MIRYLRQDSLSLVTILLAALLSFLSFDALPQRIPIRWGIDGSIVDYTYKKWGAYRYPEFMALIYFFFKLIPKIDRGRVNQLQDVGLYDPLRHGAVLIFAFNHLLSIGIGLAWISAEANYLIGAFSLLILLAGCYGIRNMGVLDRTLEFLGTFSNSESRNRFSVGLIIAGALGMVGTSTGRLQILWLLIPLAAHLIHFRIRFHREDPAL